MTGHIRNATAADVPAIVAMGRTFVEAVGLEFCDHTTTVTLSAMLDSDDAALLVAEHDGAVVAMFGGLIYPAYFNVSHRMAQELFWWTTPGERGSRLGVQLLQAFESWARERGAASVTMLSMEALRPDAVGRLYVSRGYRPFEHSFTKELQ